MKLSKQQIEKVITELGDSENSPNYSGEVTLEKGKGAKCNNYLLGQGSQTWVISQSLWDYLAN